MIIPLPENRVQELLAQEFLNPEPQEVLNTDAVISLDGARVLNYRGRSYTVPPVPYTAGLQLQKIVRGFEQISKDETAPDTAALILMDDAVRLFATLVHRPWYARLLPNPFRRASDGEVGQLLAFFWQCRMSTGVHAPQAAAHLNPRTQ